MAKFASSDVVIPLFNEREALPRLVASLEGIVDVLPGPDFLFVDDGSSDGTADLARALLARASPALRTCARVLVHDENRGLAAALRTAFDAGGGDLVLWLDADLSYPVDVLPALVARLDAGADVATVSPWHPQGDVRGVPRGRVLLSRMLSRACNRVVRRRERKARGGETSRVHTWSAMVRAWRRPLLARCLPSREGHLGVTESLLRAHALGAEIAEVPATLHARVEGRSKARILPGIAGQLSLLGAAARGRLAERSEESA